jgi:hypothetical protein
VQQKSTPDFKEEAAQNFVADRKNLQIATCNKKASL